MKKISGGKGGESMVEVKRREASGGEKWGAENFINGRGREQRKCSVRVYREGGICVGRM